MKKISILGVTGSIGESSLKICKHFNEEIKLIAVSANKNVGLILKIINEYKPEYAVIADEKTFRDYFDSNKTEYNGVKIYSGNEGIKRICSDRDNDIIINGISGNAGLLPSYCILENGIDIALANKESIVCAGPILLELSKKNNSKIIPVDSEHSALFQLLNKKDKKYIKKIFLTASGGPFLNLEKEKWHKISIDDALNHPTWKMGNKITIDSATMANKGLEVIEAHYLFNLGYEKIKVLIHPQSLIHSMVETIDSEIYAQLGPNDMSLPIQNAVFYPEMRENLYNNFCFTDNISLEIFPVDMNKFRMLKLAYECGKLGGLYPVFYNFVNELLVYRFLDKNISFLQIEELTDEALDVFDKDKINKEELTLDSIKYTEKLTEEILERII